MNRIRVGLAAAAVLAVGACGPMHPGSAVVVDDESVSVQTVDDLAKGLCEAVGASGQGGDVTGADARQQAATTMLNLTAARQAADDLGVDVAPADVALTADEKKNLKAQFPDADFSQIEKLVEIGKETNAIVTAIGEQQAGSDASDKQAQAAGQKYVQDYIQDADVDIDPRFGLDADGNAADTDPLSVKVSEDDGDTPTAQQCGA